jgi:ABC-2 type transport system permease protein
MTQPSITVRDPVVQAEEQSPPTEACDAGFSMACRAAASLAWREVVRFVRQRNRVLGAIGQPVVFWLLFGAGMKQMFVVPGQRFSVYFVPGTLVLILLLTAIFSTISVIEDRQEGFLQAVLIAPLPRWCWVLGKVVGGSVLAVGQGLIFLALVLTLGLSVPVASAIAAVPLMGLIAAGLTCLGLCLAWRLDSTQGFHAIMNLLLMPMWLLSGAFFPIPQLSGPTSWAELSLHWMMRLNPVTYAVSGLRQLLRLAPLQTVAADAPALWLPSLRTCWLVTAGFALLMFILAARIARRPAQGDFR